MTRGSAVISHFFLSLQSITITSLKSFDSNSANLKLHKKKKLQMTAILTVLDKATIASSARRKCRVGKPAAQQKSTAKEQVHVCCECVRQVLLHRGEAMANK